MEKDNEKSILDSKDLIKNSLQIFKCEVYLVNSEICVESSKNDFIKIIHFLKDHPNTNFDLLIDISAVDYPDRVLRFEIVYQFLSISLNLRLKLKLKVEDNEFVDSISSIYPSSNWYEREIWDLFGIGFKNHPDLRRILTDYDFEGFPLRKDFPLSGLVQVRYDEEKKQVIQEPVKLDQEYRDFDNLSPWEGMAKNLPGDEKSG
ncbi:NADH-quinone oxidoreductase subunit C [Rickettsiales bacterium]|nr:NADH-quinone oxidoreductase subunit C [Rickettsiales bacterium]